MPDSRLNVTILLCSGFSNMVLACALEPLRAARDRLEGSVAWSVITLDDRTATSSSALGIAPDRPCSAVLASDLLIVVVGYGFRTLLSDQTKRELRRLVRGSGTVLAADCGSWLLAEIGALDGRQATIHWQVVAELEECFPSVQVTRDQQCRSGRIWTCGSASATLDLMLEFIRESFGERLAFDVAALFVHDDRNESARPRGGLHARGSRQLCLAIRRMEETIEAPEPLMAIARYAHVSFRTLNRLFQAELHVAPGEYYRSMRLARARELAENTSMPLREIALKTGFATPAALCRAFARQFGETIGHFRSGRRQACREPPASEAGPAAF